MKEQAKPLTFVLSLDEANKIFKALGNLPFSEVYELIGKLNEQANSQLSAGNNESSEAYGHDNSLDIEQFLK